jgi:hypothetical protein
MGGLRDWRCRESRRKCARFIAANFSDGRWRRLCRKQLRRTDYFVRVVWRIALAFIAVAEFAGFFFGVVQDDAD